MGLRSLQESLYTSTAGCQFIFHVFGALAELERADPRADHGRDGGGPRPGPGWRPQGSHKRAEVRLARKLMADGNYCVQEMCRIVGVSSSTLYRYASPNTAGKARKESVV